MDKNQDSQCKNMKCLEEKLGENFQVVVLKLSLIQQERHTGFQTQELLIGNTNLCGDGDGEELF